MASQYPDVNDVQFAGLLQVATAAADAQERNATALGKRKRNDEMIIDYRLRNPAGSDDAQHLQNSVPVLQSAAAVIFREPSEKSKKYSRPPLGKVYSDMELAPEIFLRLQTAAKAFMLDPSYPERRAVVGQKKETGNNDAAKLKLWTCVEQFLNTDYNGEKYFGADAGMDIPNAPPRSFFWPHDSDKIIKLCMPLFRKMVTNERQRLYALETRKHEVKHDKGKMNTVRVESFHSMSTPSKQLSGACYNEQGMDGPLSEANGEHSNAPPTPPRTPAVSMVVYVNVVSKESGGKTRLAPRIAISLETVPTLHALNLAIQERLDLTPYHRRSAEGEKADLPHLHVWTEEGLLSLYTNKDWVYALDRMSHTEWMDEELRVVLEV